MGKNVYANGNAIAAKVGGGKVIAAFPDVCMSPPPPPAGPVPIPYPNSSFSKDLKKGSKTVKIGGKPLALKDSFYKTSPLGNEAATKSFGASVLSHQTSGKTQFVAYSFDVKVEGKNVCRHIDLATSNHGSYPGGTPPFPEMEELAIMSLEEATCPCCSEPLGDCAAALSPVLPNGAPRPDYGFSEYYRLDDGSAVGQSRSAEMASLQCEGGSCPNSDKAVPKSDPPCDVYRLLSAEESAQVEKGISNKRKRELRQLKGAPGNKAELARTVLGPFGKKEDHVAKVAADNPNWTSDEVNNSISKAIQLDHTTPRAAGGCPTSSNNTEAHCSKCSNCKAIDGLLDTWNGQEQETRREAAGI